MSKWDREVDIRRVSEREKKREKGNKKNCGY